MRQSVCWLLAAVAALLGFQAVGVSTQSATPPILLVTNSAASNKFGPYLGEILRAEGLNQFATKNLSAVTATDLNSAQVVVLAETTLTGTQANLLSNYVAGGGRLVAMRPDAQLLPALGLAPGGGSTNEGYFAVNTATAFADGFPTTTLPFHGQATNYTPSEGATTLATMYSNSTTPTAFPAVVKSGRTVTWAYDLARSVVYTRQGNPANAADRDGQPPYRTEDIFYNAIDLDKMNIPYADVQMRMLGRVINDLLGDTTPVPRLWYFPGDKRTMVVLTGDAHANPQAWFDREIASVEARGARMSLYIYNGSDPDSATVDAWRARGHEVAMHPAAYQYSRSITDALDAAYQYFVNTGMVAPGPTVRMHQVEWQGWVDAAKAMANYGVGLDTSFYSWGPAITYPDGHQAHGYINGSGLPMKFVDANGVLVPVYQQVTSLIDEGLVISDFSEHLTPDQALVVSRQLIDESQNGSYAAVTTQFHIDYFGFGEVQPWAEGTMDYAQSLGIPMWSAERWMNYNIARSATALTGFSWSGSSRQLSFSVTVPAGAEAQTVALPTGFNAFGITTILVDGSAAASSSMPITARDTTFVAIPAGTHSVLVSYNTPIPPPEHPPIAHNDTANVTEAQTVTIPVLANDTDADNDTLTVTSVSADPGAVITINPDQTISYSPNAGTCGIDPFSYTIDDGRGGTATATVTMHVTCVNGQVIHKTYTDLAASCAVPTGTIQTLVGDGEVRLAGSQGDEYTQPVLNASKWVAGNWSGGAYTPTIASGVLSLSNASGAYVRSATALPLTTLESSARFTSLPWEHLGWASLDFGGGYAIFSTYNSTTNLYARSSETGQSETQTNLGPIPTGFHTYRIERQAVSASVNVVSYYIDGVLRAQHTLGALTPMYVYQSQNGGTAQTFDIDRLWVYGPYLTSGTYQSCTLDIGHTLSVWTTANWSATVPAGASLRLRTRTSTDGTTWSGWSAPLTSSGLDITSPNGRYLQYLAEFNTTDTNVSAVLDSVTMRFADSSIPQEHAPIAISDAVSTSEGSAATLNVLANDSDPDGDAVTVSAVTQGVKGTVTINGDHSLTYTPLAGACGSDAFGYTITDGRGGSASTSVAVNIACLSGQLTHTTVADFSAVCAVPTGTMVSDAGDGEVRLAGVQSDEFAGDTLDPTLWVGGTWAGGGYAPALQNGVLSISNPDGAFVRSVSPMPTTTIEASAQFAQLPWQHVGWASLDFSGNYAIFSTYNQNTNLIARTNGGSGEQQTNLGPIPTGYHSYRVERQAGTGGDTTNYYIDGVLVAQHSTPALGSMHVYLSHNGGTAQTLDVDSLKVYPAYKTAGSYQSCAMDGGASPFTWTTASWNAAVPDGTTLLMQIRTSADGTTWSDWSAPLLTTGAPIPAQTDRYLQYLATLSTTDATISPVLSAVTMGTHLDGADSQPPVLSNITVTGITSSSAIVSWTTDELSTSNVQFGPTRAYGFENGISTPVTAHSVLLTDLTGGTVYNYRVISRDSHGNEADSQNATFATTSPTLSINSVSVTEGDVAGTTATFTVSLSSPSNQSVSVHYATAPGTATSPADFTASSGTVTFAPGITSIPVVIAIAGDTLSEANETFTVTLSSPTNAAVTTAVGVGTIVDNDPLPSVSINNVSLTEGNTGTSTATFTVSLSAASGQTVTVDYATADDTATAGSDYQAKSGSLTFAPGTTTQSVTVTVMGDTTFEQNERFFVNLGNPVKAVLGSEQGIGTILNNDPPTISIADASVTEGNSGTQPITFTVSLSGPTTSTVTVNYATASNGSAAVNSDYQSKTGSVSIPAGSTSATFTVNVVGDTLSEADETFLVNLNSPTNGVIGDGQALGTIVDNDPLPTISINNVSITEGNSGTANATFTVSVSAASGQVMTVNYATENGTATAGSDYQTRSGTITFAVGSTASQSITVPVNGDTTLEPNETFFVNLSNPVNAQIGNGQGIGTILNNDAPVVTIAPISVPEGDSGTSNAVFTVTLSQPTTSTVSMSYATSAGTATATSDYTSRSGTLQIAAGQTSGTISVPVVGDLAYEANETFTMTLSGLSNATFGNNSAVATIVNDDDPPTISIGDVSVTEGSTANFTVSLSAPSFQAIQVVYATANNTAVTGADYSSRNGTLTFAAGVVTQTISVPTVSNSTPQADRTFLVNLSGASNATIADGQAIGAIVDNDGTLTVSTPSSTGITWLAGTNQTITWTHNLGSSATFDIDLSRDGGSTWTAIAAAVPSTNATTGNYTWTVTAPTTTQGRVRVRWTVNPSVIDSSNNNFAIQVPSITASTPSLWIAGLSGTISWSSTLPASGNVKVELSRDGGATWTVVVLATTPNDGSQSVTVQTAWRTSGSTARLRITSLSDPSVSDQSDNFRIL